MLVGKMSSNEADSTSSSEVTLAETLDTINALKNNIEKEINELVNTIINNECKPIDVNITPQEIHVKRLLFANSLNKLVEKEQSMNFPIPNSSEAHYDAFKDLEEEIKLIAKVNRKVEEDNKEMNEDIVHLEKKVATFEELKKISKSTENIQKDNYAAEMSVTKRIFSQLQSDLQIVVNKLFPDNEGFQNLLLILTRALSKGGDDLYITVKPEMLIFVNFLEQADLIQFHPHDKTKIKLSNLL